MFESDHYLITKHGFSKTEIDEMLPWEREGHLNLIMRDIEEKENNG